jgi:hypothetical protein
LERTTPVLGLAWGGRSLYDEADALAGGKPVVVAARVGGEDDEPAVATFATRENVLELDIGAHVPDDAALASVATDAGRMLHADAVIVVDDDDRDAREILAAAREGRDLPRVLWTATGAGFEDASRRPRRAERQWDGALLLVADVKPDAGPPPGQRVRAAGGHPEVEPADKVLYLTADAGRFFLVPAGHELARGICGSSR